MTSIKKNRTASSPIRVVGALIIGLFLGWLMFGGSSSPDTAHDGHAHTARATTWTCSMHPQIRQSESGQCPLCGMDLIPLDVGDSADNAQEIKMSPTAMQLANVQTSVISKEMPVKTVRMNGKVQADERSVHSQTSHISGRIEKLLVNYTGEAISKGQVLAYIYSPELVTGQEELFEAHKTRESQPALYRAAREKLKNWKLSDAQIDHIIELSKPQDNFPILADMSGVVLNKRVKLGDHVHTGSSLFEVADLSNIWVLFDVYESDIPWIKNGDAIEVTIQSLPGEKFSGKISFIDPVINPKTRVARARVEMKNPGQRLKPEMFANGLVESPLNGSQPALIVPKSAVMWTGERSVVYVKNESATRVGFALREVSLGPGLGDSYVIKKGLQEGEEIATNGTFSIDAAAQLAGKPSMMNPEGGAISTGHHHGNMDMQHDALQRPGSEKITLSSSAKQVILILFDKYMKLKDAFTEDDLKKIDKSSSELQAYLAKIDMKKFKGDAHILWMNHGMPLTDAAREIVQSHDIKAARSSFIALSNHIIMLAKSFAPFDKPLFVQFCPMADENRGAEWLSREDVIRNPYFGKSMLSCGEIHQTIK